MAKTDIFNPRKHPRLLRTHVPQSENISTLLILLVLIAIIGWVIGQKNNYDPMLRDIPIEWLVEDDTTEDLKLYTPPLKAWSEPGSTTAVSAAADLGLLPASIVDAQWQPTAGVKTFNEDNLFEKINGEAPKFLRQGFQALYYLVLKSTADAGEIAIELYDQSDMAGSRGVFAEHLSADKTIEQQDAVTFFRTSIGVIGRVGPYFFRTAGDNDSAAIQQKSQQLIEAFATLQQPAAGAAADTDQPPEFRVLESFGIAPELISFQSENVFQYDFAQNFWFGASAQDDIARVFVHRAQSAAAAQELYALLLEEQSYEYELSDESEAQALLFHEFLNNFFALKVRGEFIIGIENATNAEQAYTALQQLEEALIQHE
jgi:hypothetical protein